MNPAAVAQHTYPDVIAQVAASLDAAADRPSAEILNLKPVPALDEQRRHRVEDDASHTIRPDRSERSDSVRGRMDDTFWAQFDAQMTAGRPTYQACASVAGDQPAPVGDVAPGPVAAVEPAPQAARDWSGVLDAIAAAKDTAQEQEARRIEQDADREAMDAELAQSRRQIQQLEALLQEAHARAETMVRELQARTQSLVGEAEERARAADMRAAMAEAWLERIELASREL